MSPLRFTLPLASLLLLAAMPAIAQEAPASATPATPEAEPCDLARALELYPPRFNFYLDNDLFANQDQGYTNGVRFSLVSPNVEDLRRSECLPQAAREVNAMLDMLLPKRKQGEPGQEDTQFNMVLSLAQQIYTPTDYLREDLVVEDRPYAGWLYLGFGYNARRGDQLHTTELRLGVVGPSALAETTQDFVHHLRGIPRFAGWDNQLGDEAGVQLIHERKQRFVPRDWQLQGGPWAWDAITHWGGSLGNVATYANAGIEVRFGYRLLEDFGSSALRPAADQDAPTARGEKRLGGVGVHAFVSLDGRAVARDIFLDGNTFRDSHSVDRRDFVGDAAVGVAFRASSWTLTFARYFRTREFEGQADRPGYGAMVISGSLW